jgi:hypothetical protein
MSVYNPYALQVGDIGVRAQIGNCTYWAFLGVFVVSVGGVDGTDAYSQASGGAEVIVDGVPYVLGTIALAMTSQAFTHNDWVTFDVIGTYNNGSGLIIDNIQPA